MICILFSTSSYTQINLLPKQKKVFFKTQTLLQQTCSVFQSDVTLHLCSLSLDILLSVLQTATALRNEYVFHQYQGRYKTLSPSCNVPHCPLNIANPNPKQHKLQKPPDQKHFHYTLLKTSTYPSTILFCHSPFTTYKCICKGLSRVFQSDFWQKQLMASQICWGKFLDTLKKWCINIGSSLKCYCMQLIWSIKVKFRKATTTAVEA